MSIGLLCDSLEADEMGIKLTAEELGVNLTYIPFRKVALCINNGQYALKSQGKDYSSILEEVKVILNRTQSKNRRLIAASLLETLDKKVINPLQIEFICFSKVRTLLSLCKSGVKTPKTVFIPCDPGEKTRGGVELRNEEEIVNLVQRELGTLTVLKPDAGTHGRGVKFAKTREDLLKLLEKAKPSITNPVGVLTQEFVQKWFYDLRIIVVKEKGKASFCHPKAMARAGFKDFRTNTALGNFVFDVDLPDSIQNVACKCGSIIGKNCEVWLLALDAMIPVGEDKIANDKYVKEELKKLAPSFEVVKNVRKDKSKKKDFKEWNRKLEEAFQKYKSSKAYENIKKVINETVEKNKHSVLFHEVNACPEFWEQTRLATDANLAAYLLACAESLNG